MLKTRSKMALAIRALRSRSQNRLDPDLASAGDEVDAKFATVAPSDQQPWLLTPWRSPQNICLQIQGATKNSVTFKITQCGGGLVALADSSNTGSSVTGR